MQVSALGPLEVRTDDAVIHVAGTRLRALLICLAVAAPAPVSVSALVESLWGDDPPSEPANALQSLVSRLRRTLRSADVVAQVSGGYRLMIAADDLDVRRFTRIAREGHNSLVAGRYAQAASTLREALALWRADSVDEAIERDPALHARIDEQHLDALADRIEADLMLGRASEQIAPLDQLVAQYPLRERFTLLLLRALASSGRVPEALAAYDTSRHLLADQLGIDPSPAMQAVQLALLRGESLVTVHTDSVSDEGERTNEESPIHSRSNLRAQLTSFVGRDEDVRRIGKLLGEGRLVSLVGPGGAGKTRLAIESASRLVDAQVDGIWLAELAPISDPGDVGQVVLAALGLRDSTLIDRQRVAGARDTVTQLIDALRERECILVLDNCEHLIDAAAALVDELLGKCPRLRVLTTSREPLGVYGEVLVVLSPLGQPNAGADSEVAMAYAATQLFADRAVAARPSFVVDETTVGSVVEIVRRLDGLPLAIELAAARLRTMPVEQIAARLGDRFRLLTGGSRTALPRHRTLAAVVEWSWDLLTEAERRLARRLAVFVGGITGPSAAAVCSLSDLADDEVDDLLASLVDKSLLQLIPDQGRFRMLETLREFGLDRMADVDEVSTIRGAHARYFSALAIHADPQLRTRDQLIWLAVINAERDNIVAALRFFADEGDARAALDIAMAMSWYWVLMGRHREAATWTKAALEADGELPKSLRIVGEAMVSINSAATLWTGGPGDVENKLGAMARVNVELDSVDIDDDMHPLIRVLRPVMAMMTDDRERLVRTVDEAMATGDAWTVAMVRAFRAAMAENDGDLEQVRADALASLAEFRELGERWGTGNCLQLLAPLNALSGDLDQAAAEFEESLELLSQLGAIEDESMLRFRLAEVRLRQGNVAAARREMELASRRNESRQANETFLGIDREALFGRVMLADFERQAGELETARKLRDEVLDRLARLPEPHPLQGHVSALAHTLAAKIDLASDETAAAPRHLREAYQAAVATKDMPILANVGVGVAMLAIAHQRPVDAARILGASARLRGADDATSPDIIAVRRALTDELGEADAAAEIARGRDLERDDALARLDPALLEPAVQPG